MVLLLSCSTSKCDGENNWSTNEDKYWPLVSFKDGVQMHTKRSDPFMITDNGINKLRLYAQQNSATYKPVNIMVVFDQGDYLEVDNVK
jgi:hypothetical protein